MTPRNRFEELKQTVYPSDPYTAVKQAAYKRYAQCWMGKLLRSFDGGAAIVDAFCGAGEYSDGLLGSPMTLARTFLDHSARPSFNRLDLLCLDERVDRLDHLREMCGRLSAAPSLSLNVQEPGKFEERLDDLVAQAHAGQRGRPVLWILDPYGWAAVPTSLALCCLNSGARDEVIVSLFTEEMYRFASDPNKHGTFDRVLGSDAWRGTVVPGDEAASKDRLADVYVAQLQKAGLLASKFAIAAKGHMPRYHLIYATHDERALGDCWNGTTWYLDNYYGQAAGPAEFSGQGDLFADAGQSVEGLDRLRTGISNVAGQEYSFAALTSTAVRLGFKVAQLRSVLTEMRDAGLAVRVDGAGQHSAWPESSVVRFYTEADSAI